MRRSNQAVFAALTLLLLPACLEVIATEPGDAAQRVPLPPLQLTPTAVTPGTTVTIDGVRWPTPRTLQAAVCGHGVFAVSSDCDLAHAVQFAPADNGDVQTSLVVTVPPVPCPCVVMITQVRPGAVEYLPVAIAGAPSAPLIPGPQISRPTVQISHVEVTSESSWTSWFGAAAGRVLVVTVHNGSTSTVHPLVVARWIDGSNNNVIASLPPRPIAAGRTVQLSVPFALSTFASGSFPVKGEVTGAGFVVRMRATTSTTPWALYVLVIVGVVGLLLVLATLIGRRGVKPERTVSEPQANSLGDEDLDHDSTGRLIQTGASS